MGETMESFEGFSDMFGSFFSDVPKPEPSRPEIPIPVKQLNDSLDSAQAKLKRLRVLKQREEETDRKERALKDAIHAEARSSAVPVEDVKPPRDTPHILRLLQARFVDALCVLSLIVMGSGLGRALIEAICLGGTRIHDGGVWLSSALFSLFLGIACVLASHRLEEGHALLSKALVVVPVAHSFGSVLIWALGIANTQFMGESHPLQVLVFPLTLGLMALVIFVSKVLPGRAHAAATRFEGKEQESYKQRASRHEQLLREEGARANARIEELRSAHAKELEALGLQRQEIKKSCEELERDIRQVIPDVLCEFGSASGVDETIASARKYALWALRTMRHETDAPDSHGYTSVQQLRDSYDYEENMRRRHARESRAYEEKMAEINRRKAQEDAERRRQELQPLVDAINDASDREIDALRDAAVIGTIHAEDRAQRLERELRRHRP